MFDGVEGEGLVFYVQHQRWSKAVNAASILPFN